MKKFILVFFTLFATAFPQFTEFHPELNWFTLKGEHSVVHYHEGAERTAKVIAKILDEVWQPITSLYEYEPETVHFVIKDLDDYSNGATYFFDNKIEIWASALDFDLRGGHNWLRNVISHEFTHMVQIQAAMKATRRVPALYLQMLNYEDERRPDILYGFPNVIVSYPLAGINMPAWFAEGTAQYMRKEFDYDNWDSHRDMILRSYALDGTMLTWNQMGVFEKTSLGNESVYNSGFALTSYLSQKYGEDKLREVTKALGKLKNFTIDAAFQDVLGKDGDEIYNEWKTFVTNDYKERTKKIYENLVTGEKIDSLGFGNFYSSFSSDGKKIYYISNQSSDYFSPSSIYEFNLETKEKKEITSGIRSTFGFISSTNKIIYAKLSEDNPNWYNVHDLYVYDVDTEKETRLTNDMRANQPSVSNDGKQIVFLFQKDGTSNLGMVDIDGKNFHQLTFFQNGEQVYNPKFSPDNSFIVFDYSYLNGRDIARVNTDGSNFSYLLKTENDERNPVFDRENNLIYASDKTGIYNLYQLDANTKEEKQITNVTGGAFMPAVDEKGNVAYSGYTSSGYKIFLLKKDEQKNIAVEQSYIRKNNPPIGDDKSRLGRDDFAKFDLNRLKKFNDYETPNYKSEKYSGAFSKLTFFPFLRYDNYNTSNKFMEKLKPGVYVTSNDMLNRYSLFAGASINSRFERDLFMTFEYRNKLPILFSLGLKPEMSLELFNISRKANVDILIEDLTAIKTDVTYSLFEVDIAAKHRIFSREHLLELRYAYSRYTATIGGFIFPGTSDLYPTNYDTYLIGSNFQIKYNFDAKKIYIDSDINPIGVDAELKYNYELNRFNPDGNYQVEDGVLKPLYRKFDYHKLELTTNGHISTFKNHTLSLKVRAGSILGPSVPDFFDFYLGGLIGMKAYPFYAVSGNEILWLNLAYRFPLWRNIDARIGYLYVDKMFISVYGDIGNAWTGKIPAGKTFKKGAGAELRIALNSFYLFPTSVFFNANYGFDKFTKDVRSEKVAYGGEWRFYGGILFGFDF
ncbi:MAG: biopolymer transporter Tol [Ignavibacteriaceae bacterium]|nr:biopolymer transporter Tol [Ignavibacteriaceae bacterium]